MRNKMLMYLLLSVFVAGLTPAVTSAESIQGWGLTAVDSHALMYPDFVAIAAGGSHSLALTSDGTIVGWGWDYFGQASPPEGDDFVAIAAGTSHSLALTSDGTIVGWGWDYFGQASPPEENDFVAIAAGGYHSLALKSDGNIVGWGYDGYGQATPPPGTDFVAIAAGGHQSLALKSDGTIVAWGYNYDGQVSPPAGSDFVAIAAGGAHSLALKSDGAIVGWSNDPFPSDGQASPPTGNDFVAVAAGGYHSLAIKSDGTIVGWGYDYYGQASPPAGNDFVHIAAGGYHSLALKSGGAMHIYFEDDFDGSAIDDSIWNTELATSGKRWCQSAVGGNSPPWVWQDIEVEPWMWATETPPYGTITVGGGLASFSAGYLRAFPYIWCGPPSRTSPFPATGDFIYEFRWKLDSPGQHGNGVVCPFWPNTEPEGENDPFGMGTLGLWGDSHAGWSLGSPAGSVTVPEPGVFHIFRLEYINGAYSQYVDGILRAGPTEGSFRPNAIWIGNPIFAWWSGDWDDWSDFTIDYIRILVPDYTIDVQIDIKPGSYPNAINLTGPDGNPEWPLGSWGVVPVAILSSPDFDATSVKEESVILAGASVAIRGNGKKYMAHVEDANQDGLPDLVVKVETENLDPGNFQDGYAILTGETIGGQLFEGVDEITIVPAE